MCAQREDKELKHQKNSITGRLVCKLSVDRSGQIEAFVAQRQVCTVFVNQWAANGEMQDAERYGQFGELSGHAGQHCFELLAVFKKR